MRGGWSARHHRRSRWNLSYDRRLGGRMGPGPIDRHRAARRRGLGQAPHAMVAQRALPCPAAPDAWDNPPYAGHTIVGATLVVALALRAQGDHERRPYQAHIVRSQRPVAARTRPSPDCADEAAPGGWILARTIQAIKIRKSSSRSSM